MYIEVNEDTVVCHVTGVKVKVMRFSL